MLKGKSVGLLVLLLLCASVGPVSAANSASRVSFSVLELGNGLLVWGHSWIPDHDEETGEQVLVYGEVDYLTNVSTFFLLCGSGAVWRHWTFWEDAIQLDEYWFDGARVWGVFLAGWDGHQLCLFLQSGANTEGALLRTTDLGTGEVGDLLVVGVDTSYGDLYDLFNPQHATIEFRGLCDGQWVSGVLHLFGGYGTFVIVNLWIETLETYVHFMWFFEDAYLPDVTTEDPYDVIYVPAAAITRIRINVS